MDAENLFQQLLSAHAQYAVERSHSPSTPTLDQNEQRREFVEQTPTQQDQPQSFTSIVLNGFQQHCSKESVEQLLAHGYTVNEMSQLFHTSVGKIEYCMRKHGLRSRQFVNINDHQLDQLVVNLVQLFPNAGFKMLTGHYKALGVPVSRKRLWDSITRVKLNRNAPLRRTIHRRCYSVAGPLSLWHVDGHHKLIRWKFIIHGGIDGYSRLNVFLGLSYNNRSSTVLQLFKRAVSTWGLPLRVRSDKGMENIGVCDYMLAARQETSNPFITGTSCHNQRIERLWRDVFESCLEPFHAAFYNLEHCGVLNPSDNLDIYALHYTCGTLLTTAVDKFSEGWNNHPLSTENNKTPLHLFHRGLLNLRSQGDCPELHQDQGNISFAEVESNAIEQSIIATSDQPDFQSLPLSAVHKRVLDLLVSPSTVTLENIMGNYCAVRDFIKLCISSRR